MAFARAKRLDLEIVQDDAQIDLVEEGIDVAFRMGRLMDSALTARVSHDANASSWARQPTSIVRHAVHAE
jgi:DNA-binding transcriptional LysR family regulator